MTFMNTLMNLRENAICTYVPTLVVDTLDYIHGFVIPDIIHCVEHVCTYVCIPYIACGVQSIGPHLHAHICMYVHTYVHTYIHTYVCSTYCVLAVIMAACTQTVCTYLL